jgi:hypothetical protein
MAEKPALNWDAKAKERRPFCADKSRSAPVRRERPPAPFGLGGQLLFAQFSRRASRNRRAAS